MGHPRAPDGLLLLRQPRGRCDGPRQRQGRACGRQRPRGIRAHACRGEGAAAEHRGALGASTSSLERSQGCWTRGEFEAAGGKHSGLLGSREPPTGGSGGSRRPADCRGLCTVHRERRTSGPGTSGHAACKAPRGLWRPLFMREALLASCTLRERRARGRSTGRSNPAALHGGAPSCSKNSNEHLCPALPWHQRAVGYTAAAPGRAPQLQFQRRMAQGGGTQALRRQAWMAALLPE